jgi:DUF1680 family protein
VTVTRASARPVDVARSPHARLRTLGLQDVEITGGLWARWQARNAAVSLPAGMERLDAAGSLDNLRAAAARADAGFRGRHFADSDVAKVLEAVGWELARAPTPALTAFAQTVTTLLEDAQLDDGYLNSYFQVVAPERRYRELDTSHELYCAGHLIQAAVAVERAGGDGRLLGVARRLADHLHDVFGPGGRPGIDGHPEIESALVELSRLTGEPRYAALAASQVDQRGHGLLGPGEFGSVYFQDDAPVRERSDNAGHAVRAVYLAAGVTDVHLEDGDPELLRAAERQWDDLVATKLYLTGGLGSRHHDEALGEPYELPPDTAYCETCAAIGAAMWSWRLLLATGNGRYADLMERVALNAIAVGCSLDGERFFYVNPLESAGGHARAGWYETACCPPNLMRWMATLGHYVATVDDAGVQIHQYAPAVVRADGVRLRLATDYPWDGTVTSRPRARRSGRCRYASPGGRRARVRASTARRCPRPPTGSATCGCPGPGGPATRCGSSCRCPRA